MARKVSVEIVGDSVSVQRAFQRASASASGFSRSTSRAERDFSRTTRGIAAGSGVFRGLGRSIAFASGGFLVFASAAQAIRTSIDATETSEKAFRSLGAQARASGVAVTEVFSKVGKLAGPALNLGFNKADVEAGLTVLIRGTGSAKKALSEMAAAEDVARVKGESLAQGAAQVNRALISSSNSARTLGIQFPKGASAAEKLTIILSRFAGQARALTTPTDRFNAALFNTEAIIGSALLPTLNKYLASLTNWLTKMDQSGKLQKDVASGAHDVEAAFKAVVSVFRAVDSVTGSLANTLKDLAAAWLVVETRSALIKWGVLQSGLAGVGTNAAAAETEVSALSRSLLLLRGIGPIAIAIGVTEFVSFLRAKSKDIKSQQGGNFTLQNGQTFGLGAGRAFGVSTPPVPVLPAPFAFPKFNPAKAAAAQKALAKQKAGLPLSLLGQFNIDELKLANASIGTDTALQKSILQNEESIVLRLRDQAKTLKDRTKFAQQAASIEDTIRSLDAAGVSAAKKAAASAAKTAKKAAEFAVPLQLQVDQARLEALGKPVAAILNRIKAAAERALKSGRLGLQGQLQAWTTIADVNNQLKDAANGMQLAFKQADLSKLTRGFAKTPAQRKALEAILSQVNGGFVPNKGVGAFGVAFNHNNKPIVVHTHVHLDKKEVGLAVTKVQQKRRSQNPTQRRGAFAGGL